MRKIGSPSSKDKAKEECLLRAGCRDSHRAQALARPSRHVDGGHERMGTRPNAGTWIRIEVRAGATSPG